MSVASEECREERWGFVFMTKQKLMVIIVKIVTGVYC
jgi:hypothetical protein